MTIQSQRSHSLTRCSNNADIRPKFSCVHPIFNIQYLLNASQGSCAALWSLPETRNPTLRTRLKLSVNKWRQRREHEVSLGFGLLELCRTLPFTAWALPAPFEYNGTFTCTSAQLPAIIGSFFERLPTSSGTPRVGLVSPHDSPKAIDQMIVECDNTNRKNQNQMIVETRMVQFTYELELRIDCS